ncbi:MAG: hypothetical protein JWL63_1396 [Rhodocyclales bacterium]|nr:hypothetical protein [Rhodocyclales bacterium]
MSDATNAQRNIAIVDKRPFFERVLCHGVQNGLIAPDVVDTMIADGAKGSVQIADYFGGSHLQTDLDNARRRMIHLVSLYLENSFGDDLTKAAESLRDNTFLSHSRGGNELLKQLHAMPESTLFGEGGGQPLKDFQDESTLAKPMSLAAYRNALKHRQANAATLAAARWFAQDMGVPHAQLDLTLADGVIRTAILMRMLKQQTCPTHQLFAQLLDRLRAESQTSGKVKSPRTLLDGVPEEHSDVARSIKREIEKHDAPLILDPTQTLEAVLDVFESCYFLREDGLEDLSRHDSLVSKEWHRLTQGKEDPYSRLTLFMCLAAGVKPKTSLTETEARALIRKVQENGFDELVVPQLIQTSAPFEIKQALLTLWKEEFFPEAQKYMQDDSDWDGKEALRFLKDNCNVTTKSAARKKA